MIQTTSSPSNKRKRVSGIRDFPYGCCTQSTVKNPTSGIVSEEAVTVTRSETGQSLIGSEHSCVGRVGHVDHDYHRSPACSVARFKEVESVDSIMKKAGFNVAANGNGGSGRFVSAKRKFSPSCGSKVKPLSSEETLKLMASQSTRRQLSDSSSNIQRKPLVAEAVQKQRNSPEKKKKKLSNAVALRAKTHKPTQQGDEIRSNQAGLIPVMRKNRITEVLTHREKVLKALRLFKLVFKELDRDKAARRGESKTATSRIDYKTRTILMNKGKQVNGEKMIGAVPGIEVGDEFQFKSELNLIGLHFDIMGGIDYMNRGDLKLATSIVSSEGNGYSDTFDSGVMIYSGEGGNVTSNDEKVMEDQKLVRGNLALANSMREKTPVRVIRGKARLDQRGKRYVYDGLYLVECYWQERGPGGNVLFKFKLCRVSGQPSVDFKH